MRAAECGNIKVLKLLLDWGARINAVNKVSELCRTTLHLISTSTNHDICIQNGRTVLYMAAAKNKACVVRFLCERTARIDVDATDKVQLLSHLI